MFVVSSGSGCALLSRSPKTDDVVLSRQQSLLGMEAMQHEQWEQAETLFAKAVETCPVDERARCRYAETLWHRGARKEAVTQMKEAVQLSAGDPKLLVQLGQMYLKNGQLSLALQQADRAIDINRELPSAWALRGDVLHNKQQRHQALADYHRALCYQPHYPHVQIAAAEIYRELNQPQRALTTLQALIDQYPPGGEPQQVLYLQGLALKTLERYDDATESFVAATRRSSRPDPELLFQLSETQLLAGNATNAYLTVKQALAHAPEHKAALLLRASLEDRQQRMTAALPQ